MEKSRKTVEWKTVHVFISSTFNDMHAERDYLVKKVFPRLADWCEERKIRLVDIDLRWGVSEADTMNKKVVDTCLKNIDESRPFFICLLGQRRGWVPKKDDISADTYKDFSGIDGYAGNSSVTEMEILHALIDPFHKNRKRDTVNKDEYFEPVKHAFFYLRDDSYLKSLPSTPVFLREVYTNESEENLSERENADKELKNWRDIKIPATKRPVRYYTALWNSAAITPEIRLPMAGPAEDIPALKKWRELWKKAGITLKDSDNEIPANLLDKAISFNTNFTKGRLGEFQIEDKELGDVIYCDLQEAIRERFHDQIEKVESGKLVETDLQKEIDQQEQFVSLNSPGFIERTGDFTQLDAYAANDSRKLFVLTAEAGMGKSMFLAKWVDRHREKVDPDKNESIHFRFIGQSDKSTSFYNIWHTLLEEIKENTGKIVDEVTRDADGSETKVEMIPVDPIKLHNSLPNILKRIGTKGKTIIVLDALNQLETGLKELNWLPSELPLGVKMIISFKRDRDDADAEKLYQRMQVGAELAEIKPFSGLDEKGVDVRIQLIDGYLNQYLKKLDSKHINALLEIEASKNPLFLKIILGELRIFGSFFNIKEKIHTDFGDKALSAFDGVLKRLEADPAYASIPAKIAVPLIFGLLAHSRFGLTADELAHMLFTTLGYKNKSDQLNEISESVFLYLRQVRPYLARKDGRYDFFYESFKLSSRKRYANDDSQNHLVDFRRCIAQPDLFSSINSLKTKDWHKILAEYFTKPPLWVKRKPMGDYPKPDSRGKLEIHYLDDPNMRKVSELPYHLIKADDWDGVEQTLCDIWFVEAKVRSELVFDLQEDYRAALNSLPDNLSKLRELQSREARIELWTSEILSYATAWNERRDRLARGEHITIPEPVLPEPVPVCPMWSEEKIAAEHKRINDQPSRVDRLNAFAGFVSSECSGLLENGRQEGFVIRHAFNYAPDGIIHKSASQAVPRLNAPFLTRRWPAATQSIPMPALLRTLEGHTASITTINITPNGYHAMSGGSDKTIRIWDLQNGKCLRILEHGLDVKRTDMTPDGQRAISVSWDWLPTIWDMENERKISAGQSFSELDWCEKLRKFNVKLSEWYEIVERCCEPRIWDLNNGVCLFVLKGHRGPVEAVSLTPDGRRAVSGGRDNSIRVWELENGNCLRILEGHTARVSNVCITPDGRYVISGSNDGTVRFWDTDSGKNNLILNMENSQSNNISMTPDGRYAVLSSLKGTVVVWDLQDGKCLRIFASESIVASVTPDGRRVVSGNSDRTLRVWDLSTGQCLRLLKGQSLDHLNCMSIMPDGRRAITGHLHGLRIWDLEKGAGTPERTWVGHTGGVNIVRLTADGNYAVSGSEDKTLRVWDIQSGQCLRVLEGHKSDVDFINITSDGLLVISASIYNEDHSLRVWNRESGECLHILEGHTKKIETVRQTPDGYRAVSGSWDGTLRVWDLRSGQCLRIMSGADDGNFQITADGKYAVVKDWGGLRVLNLESGQCEHTLKGHTDLVLCVSVTPDGKHAVSGGRDGTLRVWDLEKGLCVRVLVERPDVISNVIVTPDGRFAVASGDHPLKVWDLDKGECIRVLKGQKDPRIISVTPDGRRAISDEIGGPLRIWDLETGSCLNSLDGHGYDFHQFRSRVILTPDGCHMVTGSDDHALRLWELESGQCLRTLTGHKRPITSVCVTPDGMHAISGSSDKTLRFWDFEHDLEGHSSGIYQINMTLDNHRMVSSSSDNTLRIWDLQSGKCLYALAVDHNIGCFCITSDGRQVISSSSSGLKVWDLENGQIQQFYKGPSVNCMSIIPDSRLVVTAGTDKALCIWEMENGQWSILETIPNHFTCIQVTPDGRYCVSADGRWGEQDHAIRVWDLESGQCLRTLTGHTGVINSVIVTPDGQGILSASGADRGIQDNTLRLWDLSNGRCLHIFKGHSSDVMCVNITPDGRQAVSGSKDNTLRIWDLKNGHCMKILRGHNGIVNCLCVTGDGRWAVSGSDDKTIRIWDLESGQCIALFLAPSTVRSVAVSSNASSIACGIFTGEILFLEMKDILPDKANLDNLSHARPSFVAAFNLSPAICTISFHNKLSGEATCRCPVCGKDFTPNPSIISVIEGIGTSPVPSRIFYNNLSDAAFTDPRLLSSCIYCAHPLMFNPFIIHGDLVKIQLKSFILTKPEQQIGEVKLSSVRPPSMKQKAVAIEDRQDLLITWNDKDKSINSQGTTINKNQNISGIWSIKDSPFRVLGEAIIPKGQTLTIQPGVEVVFHAGKNADCQGEGFDKGFLRVNGKLIARGTKESPIRFKGDDLWGWGTILLHTDDPGCSMVHCRIEQSSFVQNAISMTVSGGKKQMGFWGGICLYESTALIENCTFVNNTYAAISCDRSSPVIMGTTIWNEGKQSSNSFVAIRCQDSSYPKVLNCTIVCKKGRGTLSYASIPVVENSILVVDPSSDQGPGYQHPQIRAWVTHSLLKIKGSDEICFDAGNNIIELNPQFDKHANDVFRLNADSPCIGAGKNGTDLGAFPLGEWVEPSVPEEMEAAFRSRLIALCSVRPIQAEVELLNGDKIKINDVRISDHGAQVDSVMLCEGFDLRAIAKLKDVSCIQHASEDSVEFTLSSGERKPWKSEGRKIIGCDLTSSLIKEIALKDVKKIIFSNWGFKNIMKLESGIDSSK